MLNAATQAIRNKISAVNDALTPQKKKAALTYNANRPATSPVKVSTKVTYPYAASKMPKGTVFGAPSK